jgi:hypothetical protein
MTETVSVPELIIDSWPEQRLSQQELRATLTYLAYKTGKPVHFRKYAAQQHFSDKLVMLYVCTQDSCPFPSDSPKLRFKGVDYELAASQPVFRAEELQGTAIADDEGTILARVEQNCITVLVEFTGEDNQAARALLAYIVEEALQLLDFQVEAVQGERERLLREHFEDWLRTTVRSLLEEKKYELTRLESDIDRAYYQIVEGEKRRPVLEEEVDKLAKLQKVPHPRLGRTQARELLELQERGLYEDILCSQARSLVATTGPVTVEYDGWQFPLGRYQVTVEPSGKLLIKALTEHPRADHPHPHVGTDGTPCLGNIHGDIAKLIGRLRIAEALQVIHSFLSSYNREGAYETISHFDPTGQYEDEEEDPCQDCDDCCSPYCINRCDHNDSRYGCGDCYEYRSEFCFEECEYNSGYELVHPCEGCDQASTEHCFLECPYNQDWQLQKPCDNCQHSECTATCPYHEKHQAAEGH